MSQTNNKHILSLATMQTVAVVIIVLTHYWFHEAWYYIGSVCVSFCFAYSGYFTARLHPFDSSYGFRSHLRFMWSKVCKLYPLHVLGIALGILSAYLMWNVTAVNLKILLAHLTLTSSWIDSQEYYFGLNSVAWYVCDLFFLYLVAPWVVRGLRAMSIGMQVVLLIMLCLIEFVLGYSDEPATGGIVLNTYYLFQFPPIRLLDYCAGIILFNVTRLSLWKDAERWLTPNRATIVELGAIAIAIVLYGPCKDFLFDHCYRAACNAMPIVMVLLGTFVLTTGCNGLVSRILSFKPLVAFSSLTTRFTCYRWAYISRCCRCSNSGVPPSIPCLTCWYNWRLCSWSHGSYTAATRYRCRDCSHRLTTDCRPEPRLQTAT